MALKLFRAVWFLSVLAVLANLLFVYASLPESVVIQETDTVSIGREWFFYILMASIIGINLLVYLFKLLVAEAEELRAWFHGLLITINIFFVVSMQALNVFNSAEVFDHSRVYFFISGSLALILLWAVAWPLYWVFQKFFFKHTV